jgi:lipid-A-disaccharide synthase
MPRRVFITVGEVSGDLHAAALVRELRKLEPETIFDGLGGPAMRAAGVNVHHDTVSRSTMGLRALLKFFEVRRLLKWTEKFCRDNPADLHVCIDSWAMNWHFARLAKRLGKPVLYYIAPQAWASRPGRARAMKACVDQLACILPFEEEWFSSRGVKTTFVGHPLFDHVQRRPPMPHEGFIVGLLPGSRKGIAGMNFPRLLEVAQIIRREMPEVRFVVPTTANTEAVVKEELSRRKYSPSPGNPGEGRGEGIQEYQQADVGPHPNPLPDYRERGPEINIVRDAFDEVVPDCDLCITVSGTATLHTAAHNVPMIVVYYGGWLAWNLIGRWLINARTFAMVNILSPTRKHIVPEFIPWNGSVAPVTRCALEFLRSPKKLAEQRRLLAEAVAPLAQAGASRKVAELARGMMTARR